MCNKNRVLPMVTTVFLKWKSGIAISLLYLLLGAREATAMTRVLRDGTHSEVTEVHGTFKNSGPRLWTLRFWEWCCADGKGKLGNNNKWSHGFDWIRRTLRFFVFLVLKFYDACPLLNIVEWMTAWAKPSVYGVVERAPPGSWEGDVCVATNVPQETKRYYWENTPTDAKCFCSGRRAWADFGGYAVLYVFTVFISIWLRAPLEGCGMNPFLIFATGYVVSTAAFYVGWYPFGWALDRSGVQTEKTETIEVPCGVNPYPLMEPLPRRRSGSDPEPFLQRFPKPSRVVGPSSPAKTWGPMRRRRSPRAHRARRREWAQRAHQSQAGAEADPAHSDPGPKTSQQTNVIGDTTTWVDGVFGGWKTWKLRRRLAPAEGTF